MRASNVVALLGAIAALFGVFYPKHIFFKRGVPWEHIGNGMYILYHDWFWGKNDNAFRLFVQNNPRVKVLNSFPLYTNMYGAPGALVLVTDQEDKPPVSRKA